MIGIRARLVEVLEAQRSASVAAVSLPGTFPAEESLPGGVRTVAVAEVTGLDLRLVGTGECRLPEGAVGWSEPPRATPERAG